MSPAQLPHLSWGSQEAGTEAHTGKDPQAGRPVQVTQMLPLYTAGGVASSAVVGWVLGAQTLSNLSVTHTWTWKRCDLGTQLWVSSVQTSQVKEQQ